MEVTPGKLVLITIHPPELFFSEISASFAILGREIMVYWQFTFSRCAIGDPVSIN